MRKTAIALTIAAFLAAGSVTLFAQSAEDAKFKKFQDGFWDTYFKFYPTAGTLQGYTKYNDKLEDPSSGALDKFHEALGKLNGELISKITRSALSPDLQVEYEMLVDFIDLENLKLEYLIPWEYNPLLYNDLFVNSLWSLLAKNPAAANANAGAAAARAKLIPGLVKRATDSLKTPPQEYTQAAIAQMPAIIEFYRTEVPKLVSAPALQAEMGKAIAALEDYQRHLQGPLLSRSTGNFRAGESHMRMLRMTTQGSLPVLEEVVQRSLADFNNIRREMFLVCIPFYKIMYPEIDIEQLGRTRGEEQTRNIVIQGVLDKIKTDHVGRDELVGRIGKAAGDLKSFIGQKQLLELPGEDLKVEPMPAYFRGSLWTRLQTPGAFETAGGYTVYARGIPADWPADTAESFLQEHNNYYIDFMTAQKVFPGVFVPAYFTYRGASPVKKMAANQALLKGWSVYLHEMLVTAGYGNFDLRTRLNQLKLLLKNVIDFQLDLNVHQGNWTKERVIEMMTGRGFMTPAEAERRWNQIVLNPGEGCMAYIGYQEILDLEKDYRRIKGDAFTAKEFLSKILSYGPIPLRTLKTKLAN